MNRAGVSTHHESGAAKESSELAQIGWWSQKNTVPCGLSHSRGPRLFAGPPGHHDVQTHPG
jgi:hypothetical protein